MFVAAYPPDHVREDFEGVVRRLSVGQPREPGRSVRLAPPDQWHITLAFLGEVPDPKADAARSTVDRAVERWRADRTGDPSGAPAVRIAGGGTFGRGRFTTLWAGLRGDLDELAGVAEALRGELRAAHLPYDNKRFRPHVTVARPGDRITADELAADLASLGAYEGPVWTVAGIRLMRSHLGPRPSYDVLHEAPLS
nr:RNA 2',3'-cyclic phosphodiesterase [Planosporangium thailandense]